MPMYSLKYLFAILLLAGTVACMQIQATPVSPEQTTPTKLVSIKQNPGFAHFKAMLALVIEDRAADRNGKHHFYVAHYDVATGITYMLWKEGRKLWILTPGTDEEDTWLGVRYPSGGQLIDLDKHLVDEQIDVGTSTYLVPKAWAHERVYDAVVNGDQIVIELQ
jgi:hypothetical protein